MKRGVLNIMRFCKNCGQLLDGDIRFCPECGVDNEDTLLLLEDKQEVSRESHMSWWTTKRKVIAGLFAIVIVLGVTVGSYSYYDNQQKVMIEKQKAEVALEQAKLQQKEKEEAAEKKKQEEDKLKVKDGINKALNVLNTNERDLHKLEDTIAKGSYSSRYYDGILDQLYNPIINTRESIDKLMQNNDPVTKNDVVALLNLQKARLDMLYNVISSKNYDAKEYFDAAQQLAERYQEKMDEFKAKYGNK